MDEVRLSRTVDEFILVVYTWAVHIIVYGAVIRGLFVLGVVVKDWQIVVAGNLICCFTWKPVKRFARWILQGLNRVMGLDKNTEWLHGYRPYDEEKEK